MRLRSKRAIISLAMLTLCSVASLVVTPGFSQGAQAQEGAPSELAKKALFWVLYTGHVKSTLSTAPTSVADIDSGAYLLSTQVGPQLGEGWLAFAALSAARSELFAQNVRAAAQEKGAAAYAQELVEKPWMAAQLGGARQAAALAAAALEASNSDASVTRIKGLSYSLQSTPWAAATITSNTDFLSTYQQASALRANHHPMLVSAMDDMNAIGDLRFALDSKQNQFFPGPFRNVIRDGIKEQILALTALRILGADKSAPDLIRRAVVLERTRSCFAAAARNMAQCTSANRRGYERAACIAQHQIEEPLACAARDVAPHSIPAAFAALSRPSHVQLLDTATAPLPVLRGPLASTPAIGQIALGSEAEIVDVMGAPVAQWFRVRGFVAADGTASRVDGWVQANRVKTYRKADTPE